MSENGDQTFRRARVMSVELTDGKMFDLRRTEEPPPHRTIRALARLHDAPIGIIEAPIERLDIVDVVRQAALIAFKDEINEHLRADGLDEVDSPCDLAKAAGPHECTFAPTHGDRKDNPHVTVVIPTLRNIDSTLECVRQHLDTHYSKFDVVVVDNDPASNELDTAMSRAFASDDRVIYTRHEAIGVSRARNHGCKVARGEIVAFTDDDVIVDRDWLGHIVTAFNEVENVGCVTGSILAAEMETPAQDWLEQFGGFNKGFKRQIYNLTDHNRAEPLYPYDAGRFGSGANMAFRKDVLESLGGFAEDLGPGTPTRGGEDIDALRRCISAGHTLVYEPAATMWHFHRRSYPALRRQLYSYGVGMSAIVMKWLLESNQTRIDVAKRLPAGLRHILHSDSTKNRLKHSDYPRELTRLELLGIVAGPFAYLQSRRRARR